MNDVVLGLLALQLVMTSCNNQTEKETTPAVLEEKEEELLFSKAEMVKDLVEKGVSEEEAGKQYDQALINHRRMSDSIAVELNNKKK